MKIALILLIGLKCIAATPPIVLWHGMGDTCCAPFSLGPFKSLIEKYLPGVYVSSLEIGNSTIEELENGYFMNPNQQVAYACKVLAADPKLQNGFNAIGFSQGCQFMRAVIQRCGHKIGPVKNFISLGGQHQGVYGVPNCGALQHTTCDYVRKLLNHAAYHNWVQESLVQATYWHDPLDEDTYKSKSIFLAEINNEQDVNVTYIENLNKLEHFVLVKFDGDTIVQPKETEWFGYYAPGQDKRMMSLQQSRLYQEDRLGLKKLEQDGKLIFLSVPGNHLKFSMEWLNNKIIKPYLR